MRREEAHRRSEMRKHFNPADGLIHNKDGSTQFLNGSPVNGVNQGYVQLSKQGVEIADLNAEIEEQETARALIQHKRQ